MQKQNQIIHYSLQLIILLFCCVTAQTTTYLFCFFKNNGEDGMHLAYSLNGESFTALNSDQSLIKPQLGKDRLMRDPSIVRGPDNIFHLVWTTGWNDRCIGYANSKDLITWSKQDSIFVMKNEPTAKNCWAPEIFYDAASDQYIIIWSTTIPGKFPETRASCDNGGNHRLYYVTSKDLKKFSETKLFYDPGFNCIDGFLAKDENRYVLVLKNETCTDAVKGFIAAKNFRIAFADAVTGPFGNLTGVLSTGGDWVEGPSMVKIGDAWYLYYDIYGKGRYGIRKSKDFKTWSGGADNMTKPNGARHGTVFAVTGFIADKGEKTGFRWEATSLQRQNQEKLSHAPSFFVARETLFYNNKSSIFQMVRVFSIDGKLLCELKPGFKGDGTLKLALVMRAPHGVMLIDATGVTGRFSTKLVW
ncbi:MAG: glycoside hydrolase family 43 protein [Chitinispirillaceae bacterium]|nr:glycoside hydrolase family 43 protein [Chitinispirillaceae bacterium]